MCAYAKNARLHGVDRLSTMLGELEQINWDIVLFSETRAESQNAILDGGHLLFTALGENSAAGVGILLHRI